MQPAPPSSDRLHGIDAVRAFALCLGVVFHSVLSFVLPPGQWAVGTSSPSLLLGWFTSYSHSFRMELFFLIAGFFAARTVRSRGLLPYLRNRMVRIVSVFVVLLYPMKLLVGTLWIVGGLRSGWLQLPSEVATLPAPLLAIGSLKLEKWPGIGLTHLWFLYYLSLFTLLSVALLAAARGARTIFRRTVSAAGPSTSLALPAWTGVLCFCLILTSILWSTAPFKVGTPDRSVALDRTLFLLYGSFYAFGWLLSASKERLATYTAGYKVYLPLGIALWTLGFLGLGKTALSGAPRAVLPFLQALSMALSTLGWLGLGLHVFSSPNARLRYLAEASYWIYLAHLPLVVALQIALHPTGMHWTLQLLLINTLAFAILLIGYRYLVRPTLLGRWLNGPLRTVGHSS